ncbi:hypothetical protein [Paraburkholderia sp. SIMBA_030]
MSPPDRYAYGCNQYSETACSASTVPAGPAHRERLDLFERLA